MVDHLECKRLVLFDEDMYTLGTSESTTEIYDNVFCESANLRDTIFKGHEF